MTTLSVCSTLKLRATLFFLSLFLLTFRVPLASLAQPDEPPLAVPGSTGGSYTLSEGELHTTGTCVGPQGTFEQSGGVHIVEGKLQLEGGVVLSGGGTAYAFYNLTGGWAYSESIDVTVAVFSQSGGTNETGDLTVGPHNAQCTFNLTAGRLHSGNTTLHGSWQGGIKQSGGSHIVSGRLSLTGDSFNQSLYRQSGGEIVCGEMEIRHGIFSHQSGEVVIAGTLLLENGVWEESNSEQHLGSLQLSGEAGSTSIIRLPADAGVLRFADSSALLWDSEAKLLIEGWNGSLSGSGSEQVFFGNNSTALTAAQLGQIWFKDPVGCAAGLYPARILPSGEIAPGPFLTSMRNGDQMTLTWDTGYFLQSSAQPGGPFEDVNGAVSPHRPVGAEDQIFFRLRKQGRSPSQSQLR